MVIDTSRHILGSYDAALSALEDDLFTMASLCERNLRNSRCGLLDRDMNLCDVTIANDAEIDQLEVQIDKSGMELLRRFQPVAGDLRTIIAAMKLSGNIERIGDQAVNIARKARELNCLPVIPEVNLLDPLYCEVTSMLNDVLRAYTESNIDLAIAMPVRDRKLDDMNRDLTEKLTARMTEVPRRITDYLDLIFIARHLERAGDHTKQMADDVVYAIAAADIRHMGERRPQSAADLLGSIASPVIPPGGVTILAS